MYVLSKLQKCTCTFYFYTIYVPIYTLTVHSMNPFINLQYTARAQFGSCHFVHPGIDSFFTSHLMHFLGHLYLAYDPWPLNWNPLFMWGPTVTSWNTCHKLLSFDLDHYALMYNISNTTPVVHQMNAAFKCYIFIHVSTETVVDIYIYIYIYNVFLYMYCYSRC